MSSTSNLRREGSVISAMTDPASLDGPATVHVSPNPSDLDVPKQVILPESPELAAESNSLPDTTVSPTMAVPPVPTAETQSLESASSPTQPVLVTTTPPSSEIHTTASTSALPDDTPDLDQATLQPQARSTTNVVVPDGSESQEGTDEYFRSPEVQNAIVERSPGGRYVRFMEKLGSGASKDVYRAYDTQEGIEVAWNVVNLSGVPKSERNRIVNEVRLLERLHHHNIISFHGSWVNRERQEVNFVTEILSSGTLKSFIHKVQVIRWKIAKRWAVQILNGLEYLHSQDPPVIHRDLKCENIFINGTSGDLRIGDLGLSTVHRNGRVLSVLGTPEFMAPDMYEESSYDEKVDIYAFGMCMLEIFTQEIPYSECNNPAQIYKKVSSGEPPGVLNRLQSRHAREFVMLCLGYKDETGKFVRPSASELLTHPFLAKRTNDDDEVLVEPPMRERAIPEASSPTVTPKSKAKVPEASQGHGLPPPVPKAQLQHAQSDSGASVGVPVSSNPPSKSQGRTRSTNSLDDDDYHGDRFDEMPESEANFRKVKVMMGRNIEFEESDATHGEAASQTVESPVHVDMALQTQTSFQGQPMEQPPQLHLQPPVPPQQVVQVQQGTHSQASQHTTMPQQHVQPQHVAQPQHMMHQQVQQSQQMMQHQPHVHPQQQVQAQQQVQVPHQEVQAQQQVQSQQVVQPLQQVQPHQQNHMSHQVVQSQSNALPQHVPNAQQAIPPQSQAPQPVANQTMQVPVAPPVAANPVPQPPMQPPSAPLHVATPPMPQHAPTLTSQSSGGEHYLVAAAVIDSEEGNVRPYADDILKLVVTLPVEGQTQHVQFDFHLIEDDPVQVAREMVQELGIPKAAVLEISETISGLARNARMKQDKYSVRMMNGQRPSQTSLAQSVGPNGEVADAMSSSGVFMGQVGSQSTAHHGFVETNQQQYTGPAQPPLYNAGAPGTGQVQHTTDSNSQSHVMSNQGVNQVQSVQQVNPTAYDLPTMAQSYPPLPTQHAPSYPQVQGQVQHAPAAQGYAHQNVHQATAPQTGTPGTQATMVAPANGDMALAGQAVGAPVAQMQAAVQQQVPVSNDGANGQALASGHSQQATTAQPPQNPAVSHVVAGGVTEVPMSSFVAGPSVVEGGAQAPTFAPLKDAPSAEIQTTGDDAASVDTDLDEDGDLDDDSDEDEDVKAELRKLEEDFQKNLQRAKKVFDSRMDNLQRTQSEREAQHLKTLEKHEKERLEFERRLALEEEQQNRRLEQLQRDWEKRRDTLAQNKKKQQNAESASSKKPEAPEMPGKPSTSSHLRSVSVSSSIQSLSPAVTEHKSLPPNGSES